MNRLIATTILFLLGFPIGCRADSGDIFISFLATPADLSPSPGHAFVCLEMLLNSGIKEDCFGFYPKGLLDTFNGQGTVESELSRAKTPDRFSKVTVSMKHKISEDGRKAVYAEIAKWSGAEYNLFVSNCGDMMFAVAKVVGLRTPPRSTIARPFDFVVGLKTYYWKGTWISSDADSRFTLEFEDADRVTWKERGASGQSIARVVKFAPSEERATIYRENTADVLQFLGFQPALTGEILARGPQPSYMTLVRKDATIEAEWRGLLVIKDVHAHLSQVRQPTTVAPKQYDFNRIP